MKKVELLAPAGNYEALTGAIAAGADAVYLGGDSFGARAYADNFTQEEICKGIQYAHVFQRKIYLTVNTLVKEKEFIRLYDFLLPFYETGLDGVIIQDLGVFTFIREHFPNLSLHVSTQMTVAGSYGAEFLKKEGASRIVPARELTLEEIKTIKKNVDIEIETFVHGAMCYCYSGQCLFSSILGGRSGNRGRCAQPCRLPYKVDGGREEYPLSMKDMCTINILPELIEAGIDSFKIEGRMKKPEYAAGVTAIYRKYIDRYYENIDTGKKDTAADYHVSEDDMEQLRSLYIRSSVSEGYYHQMNGRDMIALSTPSYSGSDPLLLARIREQYIDSEMTLPAVIEADLKAGKAAHLALTCGQAHVYLTGDMVQKAQKQPLSKQKIEEQLQKSGGTCFEVSSVQTDMDNDIFMPISALNQLRRDGLLLLQKKIIEINGLSYPERCAIPYSVYEDRKNNGDTEKNHHNPQIHVLVNTKKQLEAALSKNPNRIYVDRVILDKDFINQLTLYKKECCGEVYLAFPYIVRMKDHKHLEQLGKLLNLPVFDGALVRNLESLSYLEKQGNQKAITADANLYAWNSHSYKNLRRRAKEVYLPVELNLHEWKDLQNAALLNKAGASVVVYGRLPMMISAGCVKKTEGSCRMQSGWNILTDRYQKDFPVYNDCTYCYNIIYNSVPLSLHKLFDAKNLKAGICRLDFTVEDQTETEKIIEYFQKISVCYEEPFYKEFTTGHYKRGVE
ncbi:MAG: U32 family peptidase [Lachnospiraceae bacterium]|nr:U32 family peptidase [Lachnospiraceae bacterium]